MENTIQQKVNFEKYQQEAHEFLNKLSSDLGHPEEQNRVFIILRSVIHTVRDRITISESFDLMAQLPVILRGIYSEQWKYSEKPPMQYKTIEEMKELVKSQQAQFGEDEFNWSESTEEIISTTLNCLRQYFTEGQMNHITGQMPKEVQQLMS